MTKIVKIVEKIKMTGL